MEEDKKKAAKLNALVQMVPSTDWPERKEPPEFFNPPRTNNKSKPAKEHHEHPHHQYHSASGEGRKSHTFAQVYRKNLSQLLIYFAVCFFSNEDWLCCRDRDLHPILNTIFLPMPRERKALWKMWKTLCQPRGRRIRRARLKENLGGRMECRECVTSAKKKIFV